MWRGKVEYRAYSKQKSVGGKRRRLGNDLDRPDVVLKICKIPIRNRFDEQPLICNLRHLKGMVRNPTSTPSLQPE